MTRRPIIAWSPKITRPRSWLAPRSSETGRIQRLDPEALEERLRNAMGERARAAGRDPRADRDLRDPDDAGGLARTDDPDGELASGKVDFGNCGLGKLGNEAAGNRLPS